MTRNYIWWWGSSSSRPFRHCAGVRSINWHISQFFDDLFNFCLGCCSVNVSHKIQHLLDALMSALLVDVLSAAGLLYSLWQHRFVHWAWHPSSRQCTICGALISTGRQGCSMIWLVLCWLSGHTLRLDSLSCLASTISASRLLPWCVFLLFQSACHAPSDRQRESVHRCNLFACYYSARLMPFTTVSNSARFMCRDLFAGRNQHASSNTGPVLL